MAMADASPSIYAYAMHIPTLMAWLMPRLCVHVLRSYAYSYGLTRASPMDACAMHVHLPSWLGLRLAYKCTCYACLLTLIAWLGPHLCVHMLCMYTYSHNLAHAWDSYFHGLARALPMCAAYSMYVHLLSEPRVTL